MADDRIAAALDIGTTKICAVVGELDEHGDVYVIGHGVAPAEGLRRGVVVDMEKTVKSIRRAVDDAQLVSGVEIDRVTVGIAGEHIRSINSHGVVAVSRADREITSADVKRAIEAARTVAIPVDREIVHVIPQEFSVDEQAGIKDPVGMSGVRLEVEAHIVTASVTSARNIYRALERCRLDVDHMVLESLALAEAVLTGSETGLGCLVIDIGGDITNTCVLHDGAIRHTAVVGLGSRHVTNDLAIGLKTSVEQAEQLKLTQGAALTSEVEGDEMIEIPGLMGRPPRQVSRHLLAAIIEPRMEEILSLVAREVRRSVRQEILSAGVVLTGGGALLPGTVELTEQIFDLPARLGKCERLGHTPPELDSSRFATVHGLLLYGFNHEPVRRPRGGRVRHWMRRIEDWITQRL